MDSLKKFFPTSFMFIDSVGKFVLGIVLHVVAQLVFAGIMGLLGVVAGFIPVLGWVLLPVLGIVGFVGGAYITASLVISIIAFILNNKKAA